MVIYQVSRELINDHGQVKMTKKNKKTNHSQLLKGALAWLAWLPIESIGSIGTPIEVDS
jgi:hypothetical protein